MKFFKEMVSRYEFGRKPLTKGNRSAPIRKRSSADHFERKFPQKCSRISIYAALFRQIFVQTDLASERFCFI